MRRKTLLLVAVLALLAMTVAAPSAVSGRPGEDGPSVTITAVPSPTSGGGVGTQAVITCTLQINNPHKSGHAPGTVNVVATWLCTQPVPYLSISMKLYRGVQQVGSGFNSRVWNTYMAANAAASCVNGQYYGNAFGQVQFPPGYNPPSGSASRNSAVVSITC